MNEVHDDYTGYCVKCTEKRDFKGEVSLTKDGKTRMAKGPCPVCDTTVCRILGKSRAES